MTRIKNILTLLIGIYKKVNGIILPGFVYKKVEFVLDKKYKYNNIKVNLMIYKS